jgi:hypothetical protein
VGKPNPGSDNPTFMDYKKKTTALENELGRMGSRKDKNEMKDYLMFARIQDQLDAI